jgi:hypothetical protein
MNNHKYKILVLCLLIFIQDIYPQKTKFMMPYPVIVELSRLDEAYQILDQFSKNVWDSWDDYMNFPFLFSFQNGLRVLVGHPNPPPVFVPFPDLFVHGLKVYIDTTNLNDFIIKLPILCGGGPISFGSFNNRHVTAVEITCRTQTSLQVPNFSTAEYNILAFIHELMHCYQANILKDQYPNLEINPDFNFALFGDIEGKALAKSYEQPNYEASIPFLKDFCIARILKIKYLTQDEKNSYECVEFSEGEAVYSEFTILQNIKKGYISCSSIKNDTTYKRFQNIEDYMAFYLNMLKSSTGNTLNLYDKNYWYGCFQAILLQTYFPGWQRELENGKWLDQILQERISITGLDSLNSLHRFREIYHLDSLKTEHETRITVRNETYKKLQSQKGRIYIIDFKPIRQLLSSSVNISKKNFELGLINMYPDGLGDLKFDKVSISFKPVLTEINQLYYVKLIDAKSKESKKPYKINYESKDDKGFYYNVIVTTPLFELKAPKITIIKSTNKIKFVIHSRV